MKKYRYYNVTANDFETVISDVLPDACLNGTDIFDVASIIIVGEDVLVNDGTTVHQNATLDAYKKLRFNEIDLTTQTLIAQGFVFDFQTFSLSLPAQKNWDAIKTSKADFTFPLSIGTINNNTYSLASNDVNTFWSNGRDTVLGHLDSGRALKKLVFDAVDRTAVDAVIDTRI